MAKLIKQFADYNELTATITGGLIFIVIGMTGFAAIMVVYEGGWMSSVTAIGCWILYWLDKNNIH